MVPSFTHRYNESSLLNFLKSGSHKAFEELYDRFAPSLLGVITRIVHDERQAEDLLQDSFIKIWRNFDQYDPAKGRLFSWMYRIVRRVAFDYLRTCRRADQRIEDLPLETLGTVTPCYHMINEGYWITSTLSVNQGKMIDLVYFQGYTHQEIANEFKLPLGTVKTRVRQGLIRLKNRKSTKDLLL